MAQCSPDTRVALTAVGWLYLLDHKLKGAVNTEIKRKQTDRHREAGIAFVAAMTDIEGRPSYRQQSFSVPKSLS